MRAGLTIGAIALAASGGYLAGAWRTSPSLPAAAERGAPVAVARVDAEALRLVVREEVARAGLAARFCSPAAAANAPPQAAVPATARAVDRDVQTAIARAHDILDRALQAGTWSEDDRAALRGAMVGLPQADADDIHHLFFAALNDGRLKPNFAHAPL